MRTAFFKTLQAVAEVDSRVYLVVGDLGFGVVESFLQRLPNQYLNAAVSEQNMTGVAAGLALSGKIVFTYSIANFPTLRCLEQLRNDVCYHNANVKVVAVGGGYAYGALGMTHHATEDIAILRALPEMVVLAPGDPIETAAATRAIAQHVGPCYLRLGRAGEANVHQGRIDFKIGRAITVREGSDLTLISTGGMLQTAVEVADALKVQGLEIRVLSMHTVKPLDSAAVMCAARETGAVVTLEEHSIIGGLGSAVAEVLADAGAAIPFRRLALPCSFSTKIGSQEYLRGENGLSQRNILDAINSLVVHAGKAQIHVSAANNQVGGTGAIQGPIR